MPNRPRYTCWYCLKSFSHQPVRFVNVAHNPSEMIFSSFRCKAEWCFDTQQQKLSEMVEWMVGTYRGKFYFIKRIRKNRAQNSKSSRFSRDLRKIQPLELRKQGPLKILKVAKFKI